MKDKGSKHDTQTRMEGLFESEKKRTIKRNIKRDIDDEDSSSLTSSEEDDTN